MSALILVVLIFLIIVSIIDIKFRAVPSVILTGMLFIVAFVSMFRNPISLNLGILGLIMAYLLYEIDFIGGVADIKIITTISFMLISFQSFLLFLILLCLFGFAWKGFIKLRLKKEKEFAFIPVLTFAYITLMMLGGLFI